MAHLEAHNSCFFASCNSYPFFKLILMLPNPIYLFDEQKSHCLLFC